MLHLPAPKSAASVVCQDLQDGRRGLVILLAMVGCWLIGTSSIQAETIAPAADGTGTQVSPLGDRLDIQGGTQVGNNLFHSFQQFGLTQTQIANFLSRPTIQNILSRIIGGEPSIINGLIQISGGNSNLYLINPAGIIFGSSARLNVPASFLATSASGIGFGCGASSLSCQGWLTSTGTPDYASLTGSPNGFAFTTPQAGAVINAGNLRVGMEQTLTLLGGTVINTGSLTAPGGSITLAAVPGEQFVRLSQSGSLLSLEFLPLSSPVLSPIPLTPLSLPALLTGGTLSQATGITVNPDGTLQLTGSSPSIPVVPGTAVASGRISTAIAPQSGGMIQVLGDRVALLNASLDASGSTGGTIRIGGDYQGTGSLPTARQTFVGQDVSLRADGTTQGGQVMVWANGTTRFHGSISAQGGLQGGLVETSGQQFLDLTDARVDASAANGTAGIWLLDPTDINIITGGTGTLTAGVFDPLTTGGASQIDPIALQTALNAGTSVTLTTSSGTGGSGDMTLTTSINQTGGGNASLTLTGRRFFRAAGTTITMNSSGDLTFNLNQVAPETVAPNSSIQAAVDAIGTVNGDRTINLGNGTYSGSTLNINQRVSIQGDPSGNTILQGNGTPSVVNVTSNGVVLNRLTLTDGGGSDGGGIYNNGSLTLSNSTIRNNVANQGGGIYNNGSLSLSNSTLSGNSASSQGGGIYNNGTLSLSNSTLSGNSASSQGGGIYNNGSLSLSNSTLSGNSASNQGGGIYNNGSLTLSYSTVTNNFAGNAGGGVNNNDSASVWGTIIAGNSSPLAVDVAGSFSDFGGNLIGRSSGSGGFWVSTLVGTNANPIDPLLAPLANNGGLTQTHLPLPGSSAINAGSNLGAPGTDQRGFARIVGGRIDIGAVETTSPDPPVLRQVRTVPLVQSSSDRLSRPTQLADLLALAEIPTLPALTTAISAALSPLTTGDRAAQRGDQDDVSLNQSLNQSRMDHSLSEVEQSLSQDYEQYFGFRQSRRITASEIRQILSKAAETRGIHAAIVYAVFAPAVITPDPNVTGDTSGTALPPFLRSNQARQDDRLDLILITPNGQTIRRSTHATRAQVIQQAELFRLVASDPEDPDYTALAHQLYGWLLAPLEAELQAAAITQLIYCLDEGLRTIPLAAMQDGRTFVIDRYSLAMIPSVGLTNLAVTDLRDRPLVAMGADRFASLDPLPAVPTELTLVSQQFWQGTFFLNQEFTLTGLQSRQRQYQPGIMHLATHARFNPGRPEQSYIQLWDQRLNLSQMRSLNWSQPTLDLLVLSACSTAVGNADAELGFAGLAAAAGIPSTLGSLWEVSDIGTLVLMSEFYIQLRSAPSRAEALRRAQLALRQGRTRIEQGNLRTSRTTIPLPARLTQKRSANLTHPFYWSGFTLVGNPW